MRPIAQPSVSTSKSSNSSDISFFSKLRQGFVQCKPILNYDDNYIHEARKRVRLRDGKRLTYLETKALSEYGASLSEYQNDHQGAIVTLMRVRSLVIVMN